MESTLRAMNWIGQCTQNHPRCGRSNPSPLPTRVLDLGDCKPLREIRLVEFPEHPIGRYVTLSHCWGSFRSDILTTSKTLERNKRGISWPLLPKTFQDAAAMTQRLGIRYLWIDCFCIIQDDQDDWARESSNMAVIFENAYITLAAAKSPNANGGLFYDTPPEFQDHVLMYTASDDIKWPVLVRRMTHHWKSNPGHDTTSFPLLTRGWVFQEILLSPRILYFSDELWWSCMEMGGCECSINLPKSLENHAEYYGVIEHNPKERHYNLLSTDCSVSATLNRNIGVAWRSMIADYSRLKLTFEKDKLPAIAGLANQMRRHMRSRYLAGLWEDTLLEDLLWTVPTVYYLRPRPSVWRAPTWSWASVDNDIWYPILNFDESEHRNFYILDVRIVSRGLGDTGEVASGRLVVKGRIVSCELKCYIEELTKKRQYFVSAAAGRWETFIADYALCSDDLHCHGDGYRTCCLFMARDNRSHQFYMLILRFASETDEYERIGIAEVKSEFLDVLFPEPANHSTIVII
jgi:hypothetical protein